MSSPNGNVIRPQPTQEKLLSSPADIAVYGGAAGAGKSFALLMQPILHIKNPGFGCVIFRKTNPMIVGEGGLWDKSQELYPLVGGKPYYGNPKQWVFKSGAKVTLSHMQHEKDKHNWDGQQIPLIEWDELDQFSESQFWYMLSRNRSTCGVRPYMRATCLAAHTLIQCADGRLRQIADLWGCRDSLWSTEAATGKLFAETPTNFYHRRPVSGLRVVTNHGEIVCTADHKLFRWSEAGEPVAVAASELKPDDYLAAAKSIPHGTRRIGTDEAYLIGYTVGDGGVTGREGIPRLYWTENCADHGRYVAGLASRVLGVRIGVHKRKGKNCVSFYTTQEAVDFIARNREAVGPAVTRAIPEYATAADEAGCRALLQGLYDAEGHVSYQGVEIGMVSRTAIQQVSMLLRRWGIIARYGTYQPRSRNRKLVYRLMLCGRQAAAFARLIGFRIPRKQEAAMALAENADANASQRMQEADAIPIDREAIAHLKPSFGKSWWNRNTTIRRDTAVKAITEAVAAGIDPAPMSIWASYSWERIICIEVVNLTDAFDVTMPTSHIYFAGNLLSHNCNPNSESWVAKLLEWWIDQDSGYPVKERSGAMRYFIRLDGKLEWADSWGEMHSRFPDLVLPAGAAVSDTERRMRPLSLTFVPARLDDNRILETKDPEYRAKLMAMPLVERERLLNGNWKIRPEAGLKFPRDKWVLKDACPADGIRWCRFWDKAYTEGGTGAKTAGALIGELTNHAALGLPRFWIRHVDSGRWGDAERESRIKSRAEFDRAAFGYVTIGLEQEGGAGKHSANMTVNNLAGHDVFTERPTAKKHIRWQPLAAQQQIKNVAIVTTPDWDWAGVIDELDALAGDEALDKGKLRDVADALSGGFKFLTAAGGVIQGELLASGDPDHLEEESKPYSEEEIGELPDDWKELIVESNEAAKERRGFGRWDD